MIYTIANDKLTVRVESRGGELMSIRAADGTEYLWQGDAQYWKMRAPHLFPVVGRLTGGVCTLEGEPCHMELHGFFRFREMTLIRQESDTLALGMESDVETLGQYPRRWSVVLEYRLEGEKLLHRFRVENRDEKDMWFAYGGHPGFRVPLVEGLGFEDYELRFSEPCAPQAVGMSDTCYLQGLDTPFPLEGGQTLPLRHSLFDHDAVFLKDTSRRVTLRSARDTHTVTVDYPDMPMVGIWHAPRTEAPYVCIEPWTALPARQDVVEELSQTPYMCRLAPSDTWSTEWSVTCTA